MMQSSCHRNVLVNPLVDVMAEHVCRVLQCGERPQVRVAEAAGLYVHVPFCRSKCRYCGFYSVPVTGQDTKRLVAAMIRELDCCDGVEFRTAYIGGGSPTALPSEQLLALARKIRERFAGIEEFTVECNPGQVCAELLARLRQVGVNRLSFGAQSFHAAELQLLGRGHCVEDIGQAVRLARCAGFDNIGLDLIFAIPGSTPGDWQYSVEAVIDLEVQHVSAYSLSFESGTVFDAWRQAGWLHAVDEELDRVMYDWVIERLGTAGIEQYEISNFARPGFECLHNLGYWANRPFVGIGPGAASSSAGILPVVKNPWARRPCYEQSYRITTDPDIERYVAAVEAGGDVPGEVQPVSDEDVVCETAVLNLRRRSGIDLAEFQRRTGHDAMQMFAGPIQRDRDLGFIEVTDRAVRLTRQALPIADSILCDFAALE